VKSSFIVDLASSDAVMPCCFFTVVDSTTVTTSSTTKPVGSTKSNRVGLVEREIKSERRTKVPIKATRMAMPGAG